jgi:hypothetical protein
LSAINALSKPFWCRGGAGGGRRKVFASLNFLLSVVVGIAEEIKMDGIMHPKTA